MHRGNSGDIAVQREVAYHGCNTVSLSCDFVSPGKLGETIESHVRVTRKTRTMVFISAEISSGGKPLLIATGLWKVAGQS